MSKARRISDVERTATMLDLLHRSYEGEGIERDIARPYVVLEEVAPGTGWYGGQRWADVLVLSVWPSNGLTLDGYEVKASRADLKKELSQPSKHQALARFCDTWTLVAWDESVLVDGIPESWGITLTTEDEHQCRSLHHQRKAPKRTPEPWPRSFICSLVRNAFEQSPGAAYVARAVLAAQERARSEYRQARERDLLAAVQPLGRALYGKDYWHGRYDAEDLIKLATERLTQPLLAAEGGR